MPVPSTVPVIEDAEGAARVRACCLPHAEGSLVGHFGTYPPHASEQLAQVLTALLARRESCAALLLGRGGEALRERILREHPHLAGRLHAKGLLPRREISTHLAACDLVLLPFPDGVSTRRTSAMAALAHGLAVVTTRGRLTEPLWDESRAVELVEAGDARAMCGAAERLLADEDERARLSAAARVLYGERFDLARTISALRRGVEDEQSAREVLAAEAKA
jgi:glycosyltransferase involved in cell wall biosynthesis